jgi:hypothetical protein
MAYVYFDAEDIVSGNVVRGVTGTAFSNGSGSITVFHTSSTQTASAAGNFQWDIYNLNPTTNTTAETQFSVAYGHATGLGSAKRTGATAGLSPSRAIYSQFRQILLNDTADTTRFIMGDNVSCDKMFFITMNRARYKQGMNANNWELHLSSSHTSNVFGGTAGTPLKLIDDSSVSSGNTVNGHLVYNVVSGSDADGVYTDGSSDYHHWGLFYPQLGIIALNGNKIITGSGAVGSTTYGLDMGEAATLNYGTGSNADDSMNDVIFTAIEDGMRTKNSQFNYSTNPTYQTGSNGQIKHSSFIQNPQTFVTTVGLYSEQNELLAVAKLSKPLLKNFERETTIRVKLDY